MSKHKHRFDLGRLVTAITVLAAVGLIFGCGTDTVLNPPGTLSGAGVRSEQAVDLGLAGPILQGSEELWSEVGSGEALPGTTTEIAGSRYSLSFYPESLKDPANITIKERDPGIVAVELGPEGTKFSEPVKLVIDYAGTANDPDSKEFHGYRPQLYWWNPEARIWEEVPGTNDKEAKTCTVYLEHFSHYAMRDGIGPQNTKGGGQAHGTVSDTDEQQWDGEQQWH